MAGGHRTPPDGGHGLLRAGGPRLNAKETVPQGPEPPGQSRAAQAGRFCCDARCPGRVSERWEVVAPFTPRARLKRCVSKGSCVGVFKTAELAGRGSERLAAASGG